jgi:uncharacterized SAM-binding protein YcdF (DUF218 family)
MLLAFALAAGAPALAAASLAFAVDRFGRRDGAGRADVIIVLGAQVLEGERASPALRARVERGVALFHRGLAPRLLLSGGGHRGPTSEAEIMRRIAAAQGVPDVAILLEPESRNTAENAYLSSAMMRRHGFESAIVVSDPFHLLRARQWFRRAGVEVGTSPAPLSGRGFTWVDRLFWTLREALALAGSPRLLFARPAAFRGERS